MTQQFDLVGLPLDEATTRRIALPQPREVRKPKLRDVLGEASRFDVGHDLVLAERAREDYR